MRLSTLILLPALLIVGCHTPQVSLDSATSDGDGYPVTHRPAYPAFGPLENKLVETNRRAEGLASAYTALEERNDELGRDIERYRMRVTQLERENSSLRAQLVERDTLLAKGFQPAKPRWHGSRGRSLTQLRRENARLRVQLAERDRALAAARVARAARRKPVTRTAPPARVHEPKLAPPTEIPETAPPVTTRTISTVEAKKPARPAVVKARPVKAKPAKQYRLRIIALSYTEANRARVQGIVSHLAKSGVTEPARVKRAGNHWVIDVGAFDSSKSAEARAFVHKVRRLRYQGRREFRSAYFTLN